MICGPNLLFLDEWTESLDESAARRLIEKVKKMREQGSSLIIVSHDIKIIRELADIVVVIAGGKLYLQLAKDQITCDEDIKRCLEGETV